MYRPTMGLGVACSHEQQPGRHGTVRMAGIGMPEVLVALVVLSIGVLGLARLQGVATRHNHRAYLRSKATLLARGIAERMRANAGHADAYLLAMNADPPAGGGTAARDLRIWRQALESSLPGGRGSIRDDGYGYVITVRYGVTAQYQTASKQPLKTVRVSFATALAP